MKSGITKFEQTRNECLDLCLEVCMKNTIKQSTYNGYRAYRLQKERDYDFRYLINDCGCCYNSSFSFIVLFEMVELLSYDHFFVDRLV